MDRAHHNGLIEADPYLVAFSPTNPRKRRGLDIDSLRALADSIQAQGLAQPILVRPLPGSRTEDTFNEREEGRPLPEFELVCGERRLRACRMAEVSPIPMLVRDLNDEQALELQLVENIEREDLDPLEEAEGFELLRTKLGYSLEQIGERIGKGKGPSYIRKTLKLLDLTPESREAMFEGHLGRSTGLLVARYPAAKQAQVVEFIKDQAFNGEPAPYREIAPQIYRRFNLLMAKAVWDLEDAKLVPAAGACSSCPKRSGAHGDLFGDDKNEDSCTDPDCFEGKREAHIEAVKKKAAKDGFKVVSEDEARSATSAYSDSVHGDFVALDEVAYTEKGDDGKEREVTFGDALRKMGKKAPKPRILINPHTGKSHQVITSDLADKLQPEEADDARGSRVTHREVDTRPPEVQALEDYEVKRAVIIRAFDAIRSRARTDGDMLLIAKALFNGDNAPDHLATYLNWSADLEDQSYDDVPRLIEAKLEALPAADLAAVITMFAVETLLDDWARPAEDRVAIAQQLGVDILAVRDKVAEDLAAGDDDLEAEIGARVRIKDDVRGPNGKKRKICGREGELTTRIEGGDSDDWMFLADGAKEEARVTREEFIVLAGPQEDEEPTS